MQLRRLIAGGLVAASTLIIPLSSVAHADIKAGGGTTTYCYRPGDETTKTNPYSVGSTYTDWSTTPPRTYKCGADGTFTVMAIKVHGVGTAQRVPAGQVRSAR